MTCKMPGAHRLPVWLRRSLWLVAFIAVPLLVDQWRHQDAPDLAPRQQLVSLGGAAVDIQAMSMERPVVVYFWATWCPVCKLVSPSVDALREDQPVVTVAMSSGSAGRVESYATGHGLGFPIVNDADGHISRAWGVRATPTVAVVYRGRIQSMTSGITTPPGIVLRLWLAGLSLPVSAPDTFSPNSKPSEPENLT